MAALNRRPGRIAPASSAFDDTKKCRWCRVGGSRGCAPPAPSYDQSERVVGGTRAVDLRLLARHRPQPLERFRGFARPEATDETPEMIGPAGVAALLNHDEQPARAQARVLLKLLDDERDVRVDHGRPRRDYLPVDARLSQHALHRRVMDAQLAGDGADGPLLAAGRAPRASLR